jgi:alkyl hydroperoxide reductase subunit D
MNIQEFFEKTVGEMTTSVRRDLGNNLQKIVESSSLTPQEAYLLMLSVSQSLALTSFRDFAEDKLKSLDMTAEQILEGRESAAIMGMNNIYYRFRHMIKTGQSHEVAESYKMAGLRMTSLAKPVLGKPVFELLALAVSSINGCEMCVNSHEVELRKHGIEPDKIHDAVRLAAILKGISALN